MKQALYKVGDTIRFRLPNTTEVIAVIAIVDKVDFSVFDNEYVYYTDGGHQVYEPDIE